MPNMAKQKYIFITDIDLIDYASSDYRHDVLDYFKPFAVPNVKEHKKIDFSKFDDKTKLLIYFDSVVQFAHHEEISEMLLEKFFGARQDIIKKYLILGKPIEEFTQDVRDVQQKAMLKPAEKVKASVEAKFLYSLLFYSQMRYYSGQFAKKGWETTEEDQQITNNCDKKIDLVKRNYQKEMRYER